MSYRTIITTLAVLAVGTAVAAPAHAKCTRLGFSVNDYGKDGPTKDAKDLLDKHVAKWTADNGIAKYTTGKKDVKCDLFLDFIVFDEHTCRAEATVCWNEKAQSKTPITAAAPKATDAVKKPAAKKGAVAPASDDATNTTPKKTAAPAAAPKPAAATIEAKSGANITTGTIEKKAEGTAAAKPAAPASLTAPAAVKPAAQAATSPTAPAKTQ